MTSSDFYNLTLITHIVTISLSCIGMIAAAALPANRQKSMYSTSLLSGVVGLVSAAILVLMGGSVARVCIGGGLYVVCAIYVGLRIRSSAHVSV